MVASLVNLEHQVAKLVHHVEVGGHTLVHHEVVSKHGDGDERFAMHDDGLSHYTNRREPHQSETLVKLEGQIHALQHQVHELMKNNHSYTRST